MNEKNIKVKNIIPKCGADIVVPFAFVYMFYIILHGHLSPGGGFQGGVMMVAVVMIFALMSSVCIVALVLGLFLRLLLGLLLRT